MTDKTQWCAVTETECAGVCRESHGDNTHKCPAHYDKAKWDREHGGRIK
jgi:hypothetical protein